MLFYRFTQSRTHTLENMSTTVPDVSVSQSSHRANILTKFTVLACGTHNPGLASLAKTLGASRSNSASLAKTAVFNDFCAKFTVLLTFLLRFTEEYSYF